MIAALPMYDWPELRSFNDRFWVDLCSALRRRGVMAPEQLCRVGDYRDLWLNPDLLFAQTCGLPYNTTVSGQVQYLATPMYLSTGCERATYSSAIIVSADRAGMDLAGALRTGLAVNGRDSWSGHVVLQRHCSALDVPFPDPTLLSGGHRFSMEAVADGEAGVAAIDSVAWGLAERHLPDLTRRLAVIGWTESAPATPFITARNADRETVDALREALVEVTRTEAGGSSARDILLGGIDVLADNAYQHMRPLELA